MCGSPTVISKVGFAAFSTLILGSDCRFAPSASLGGCTGGGPRNPAPSSSRFTESAKPVPADAWEADDVGRTLRPENSFCGGAGACSRGLVSALSPSGPRGSNESSTASNFVACALILRVPRGPRRTGERGALGLACCVGWSGAGRCRHQVRKLGQEVQGCKMLFRDIHVSSASDRDA